MSKHKFGVGDRVEVVGDTYDVGHKQPVGTIITITEVYDKAWMKEEFDLSVLGYGFETYGRDGFTVFWALTEDDVQDIYPELTDEAMNEVYVSLGVQMQLEGT